MIRYIQIQNNSDLPDIKNLNPFRAVVVIDEAISDEWQIKTSKWLVNSGCLYMMAWGNDCSSWDDSVDYANLEEWNYEEIPEQSSVMTTWHEKDSIEEVFWYAKYSAFHSVVDIKNLVILHISSTSKEKEFINMYKVV